MGTHSNTNYSGILSNAPAVPLCLPVFGPTVRSIWAVVLTATVLSEVLPIPHMTLVSFYSYCAGKAVMFLAVGYLTPLAFWRFDDRGFLAAAACAAFVETLQGIVGRGHSFHWYEMGVKLMLIFLGFVLALEARYERRILHGRLRIQLVSPHFRD
jgi:hypothetical protein